MTRLILLFAFLAISFSAFSKEKECWRVELVQTGYRPPNAPASDPRTYAIVNDGPCNGMPNAHCIHCEGSGDKTCPKCPGLFIPTTPPINPLTPFEVERYSSLYDYSKDQIDNGDTSGSYQEIWFNVDSGRSEKFVVEWTVDENGTVNHYIWLEPVIYQGQ